MKPARANLYLSLGCIGFALLLALVWAPMDSGTGLIHKVRRQVSIGDALAPTLAAVMIGIGGLMVLRERHAEDQQGLTRANLVFVLRFLFMLVVGFALMRYSGPLLVWLFGGDQEYRNLRDTAPWKYIGFFLGSSALITALIASTEGRFSRRAVVIAVAATLALIALYDLPFDDLLLPPNGDV
jgi:4-amino-4-deoxy-L-arabinose transferase-like glycosyltransferase